MYVDYVLVYSDTFEKHVQNVYQVHRLVREDRLALNIAKCHFFRTCVYYLDHVFVPRKLKLAQKITCLIRQAKFPETQTDLCSFLGMCNVLLVSCQSSAPYLSPKQASH